MNARVRGALFGAAIGAAVGALYGFMFVAYRERMAQVQQARTMEVPEPNGTFISPEVKDPERRPDHRTERMRKITGRARELREASPELPWRDAMRQAAQEHADG